MTHPSGVSGCSDGEASAVRHRGSPRAASRRRRPAVAALVLSLGLAASACSRDARSYFEAGKTHAEKGEHREAIIELRNAVQRDPSFGEAHRLLAASYLKVGDAANAATELIRAADLLPKDPALQLQAGAALLQQRKYEEARARASRVLSVQPANIDALVLSANAMAGLSAFDEAIDQLGDAIELGATPGLYANLGLLESARGRSTEAEAAFRQAVASAPKDPGPRLALANFLWGTGRVREAEAEIKAALRESPGDPLANRAMGVLLITTGRGEQAEPYLRTAAEQSEAIGARLQLADYYIAARRFADATKVLQTAEKERGGWVPARVRLASIRRSDGKASEALAMLEEVLAKAPRSVDGLGLKARVLLETGKTEDARRAAQAAVDVDPTRAGSHYLLGLVDIARADYEAAAADFQETLRLSPTASAAQVQLARLELRRGSQAGATQLLDRVLEREPQNVPARLMRARTYLRTGQLDRADREMKTVVAAHPNTAVVQAELGTLRAAQGSAAAARTAYERALSLDPSSHEALAGLTALDVRERRLDPARARLDAWLKQAPRDATAWRLRASVSLASRDQAGAEKELRRAIEADPKDFNAYALLGRLYATQGHLDQARSEFEAVAARQPHSAGPPTMIGVLLQAQGKKAEAEKRYEQALAIEPRAPVAANNLAWLYAERGTNLDEALRLAQNSYAQLSSISAAADTLGYVFLVRKEPAQAIAPLRDAVAKEPGNPVYRYRLGLAYDEAGQREAAVRELKQALNMTPAFDGADDARRRLSATP